MLTIAECHFVHELSQKLPNGLSLETRKYQKNLKTGWQSLFPGFRPRNKTLILVAKKYGETDIKDF